MFSKLFGNGLGNSFARACSSMFAVIVASVALAGCGTDTNTSSEPIDDTYAPRESLNVAVEDLLGALQNNDYATSFALLTPQSRDDYPDVDDWRERRTELAPVTGYRLIDSDEEGQTAIVEHVPGLSPFTGLSVAEERITWKGERFESGWLLEAEPTVIPVYPDDAEAPAAAREWLEAVRSCDRERATALQGVSTLFAGSNITVCGIQGEFALGDTEKLSDGLVANQLTAQYSSDASSWARVVPVSSPVPIQVILAPIGNVWKVIGVG